jgi:hypothetical protein
MTPIVNRKFNLDKKKDRFKFALRSVCRKFHNHYKVKTYDSNINRNPEKINHKKLSSRKK